MSSIKKVYLEWNGNFKFEAKNEVGLKVSFDAPKSAGGDETALSPMENLLASLAACSSYSVVSILKKKRQIITDYSVEATAQKRDEPPPKIFTQIHLKYKLKGPNIDPKAVERSIKLSEEKYCSVADMIKKTVDITSSFEITE